MTCAPPPPRSTRPRSAKPRHRDLDLSIVKRTSLRENPAPGRHAGRSQAIASSPRGDAAAALQAAHDAAALARAHPTASAPLRGSENEEGEEGDDDGLSMKKSLASEAAGRESGVSLHWQVRGKRAAGTSKGTWGFRTTPRDAGRRDAPPPIGHYRPKFELIHPRVRNAAMGRAERVSYSRLPGPSSAEIEAEREELMAEKNARAATAPAQINREVEAELESVPFRSKVPMRKSLIFAGADVPFVGPDELDAADLGGRRGLCLVNMESSLPRKSPAKSDMVDTFYYASDAAIRPRTATGAHVFDLQLERPPLLDPPLDLAYDYADPSVNASLSSRTLVNMDKQLPRDHGASHVVQPFEPSTNTPDASEHFRGSSRDAHIPTVHIGKGASRKPLDPPASVDTFYDPSYDGVRPRPRQPPRFDDVPGFPPRAHPVNDLTYDVSYTAIEPAVPVAHLPPRLNNNKNRNKKKNGQTSAKPQREVAPPPERSYEPKYEVVEKRVYGGIDFGKTLGREWVAPAKSILDRPERALGGQSRRQGRNQPIPDRVPLHIPSVDLSKALPRSAKDGRFAPRPVYDLTYDPNENAVRPHTAVVTLGRGRSRRGGSRA